MAPAAATSRARATWTYRAIPSRYAPPSASVWPRLPIEPMSPYVPQEVEAYAERYTTAGWQGFDRLAEETRATQSAPQMMVGDVEGAFLSFLVTMTNAKRVLEVGTFTGWSSIAMARALPPGGSIVTCDVNEETTAVAGRDGGEAGVAARSGDR